MARALSIVIAAAATLVSAACTRDHTEDAGPQANRSFNVGNFSGIEVAGHYDVRVTTGGKPGVTVSGPQNVIDHMVVEVKGDELRIHPRKEGAFGKAMHFRNHEPVRVEVTVPSLREATIAGSGNIEVDKVSGGPFEGTIAGSGSLSLPSLDVQSLKITIAGSGGVTGAGKAATGEHSIAGSGDMDLSKVVHQDVNATIAGSGDIRATATGKADISIMGSGNVDITGGAKCKVSKMGSGSANCS